MEEYLKCHFGRDVSCYNVRGTINKLRIILSFGRAVWSPAWEEYGAPLKDGEKMARRISTAESQAEILKSGIWNLDSGFRKPKSEIYFVR